MQMAERSNIIWTDATWNPVTGCSKVSQGCKFCYAERLAKQLQAEGSHRYRNSFQVTLHPDVLDLPLPWKTPKRVFVNSMSDLFHVDVPDDFIAKVFGIMLKAPQHTFQILTKRPERVVAMANDLSWADNIWMGTSIENDQVVGRADLLRHVPARVRFLSCEPLIGPLPSLHLEGIHWVIVGGESGPGHRPIKEAWVEDIRGRCEELGIPFLFKQWGGDTPKSGGRLLHGRTWDGIPDW